MHSSRRSASRVAGHSIVLYSVNAALAGAAFLFTQSCSPSAAASPMEAQAAASQTPAAAAGSPQEPRNASATTASSPAAPRPAVGEGILHLASNQPRVDPMVATADAPFFPSRASTGGNLVTHDMFTKAESCKECHTDIYQQWSESIMGHSWRDPIYRALLKLASNATDKAVDRFCIGCHTPIGLVTGTADAIKGDNAGFECADVDCESCHTISASSGAGNGSYVITPVVAGRPVKFGPRDDAFSPFHDTVKSDLHTKSEMCAVCHNVTHPFNRLPVERTYDEWRDSPYSSAGVTCQDCHMVKEPGVTANPGRSAPDGKERPHIFAHTFAGANVTLHEVFGNDAAAERARKMLQSAATIEIVDKPASLGAGQTAAIRIKVTNVGAGHKLPTGFPEGREMWIDLKVTDADGKEIYRQGRIEGGHTEPGTHSFKATLGDAKGNVVEHEVWLADRVLSDTRILPKGWQLADYTFEVPGGARGPLQLVADLNYWSFPQAVLDGLLGKGEVTSKVTLMAQLKCEIPLAAKVANSGAVSAEPERGNR